MKRTAGLVAALLLATCSSPPMPQMCGPSGTGMFPVVQDGIGVAGDVLSITLQLAMSCPDSVTPRVTVSVQDPNNLTLPLAEGELTRDAEVLPTNTGMQTVVKVRATTPGPYHFTARFEPNLGIVQKDVRVAEDHRDAGPELTMRSNSALAQCRHIDLTEGGRPLCLSKPVRLYERDGGILITFDTNGEAARVGNVLWVSSANGVSRYVETADGFAGSPDAGLGLFGTPKRIAADEGGLFVTENSRLSLVSVDDAGAFTNQIHGGFLTSDPLVLWKRGDEFLLIGSLQPFDSQLCSGRFRDGGRCDSTGMFGTAVSPLATEPAGLWTWFDDQRVFPAAKVVVLRTTTTLRELQLPEPWHPVDAGSFPWDQGAFIRNDSTGQDMLLLDRQGEFVLQKFRDLRLLSVTSRYVSLVTPSGEVLVYRR